MNSTCRQATNPLTGEELVVRDVINETVDTTRLSVLRALGTLGNPTTRTDITDHAEISRQAVSNHLAVLRDRGFVRNHETEIKSTAGGLLLLDVIETCLKTIPLQELAFLTRSDHPISILQTLKDESYRLTDLNTAVGDPPSQPTIRRVLGDLLEYGWTEDHGGNHRITTAGREALNAYRELSLAVQQLIEKAPWLQRLPPEDATFPIHSLADAKLIVSNPANPGSVLSTVFNLYDRDTSRFRGLCSIYHPVLFSAYRTAYELLNFSIDSEIIFDWPTFVKIANTSKTHYILDSLDLSDYDIYTLDFAHTLGIGIYDDRRVAIGAYNEAGSGNHVAMIISSNNELVDWGIGLYDSYLEQSTHADKIDLSR